MESKTDTKKLNTSIHFVEKALNEEIRKSYKPEECRAVVWSKPGIERIYLRGKKADGFVQMVEGRWTSSGIRYMMLGRIVDGILSPINSGLAQ